MKAGGADNGRKEGGRERRREGTKEGGRADLTSRAATVHQILSCPGAVKASLDGPNNPKTANHARPHESSGGTSRRNDNNRGSDRAKGGGTKREREEYENPLYRETHTFIL